MTVGADVQGRERFSTVLFIEIRSERLWKKPILGYIHTQLTAPGRAPDWLLTLSRAFVFREMGHHTKILQRRPTPNRVPRAFALRRPIEPAALRLNRHVLQTMAVSIPSSSSCLRRLLRRLRRLR